MLPFSGKHALIIEDDEVSVRVLQRMLEQLGFAVLAMYDSLHAVQQMRGMVPPDVIFLDLEMPRSNGYVVLHLIREIPSLHLVPVIAYTTHTSHLNQAHEAGFNGLLGKPLDHTKFADQVRRILAGEAVWEVPD